MLGSYYFVASDNLVASSGITSRNQYFGIHRERLMKSSISVAISSICSRRTIEILFIFCLSGCAASKVDWFVQTAIDPNKVNLDTRYCLAA